MLKKTIVKLVFNIPFINLKNVSWQIIWTQKQQQPCWGSQREITEDRDAKCEKERKKNKNKNKRQERMLDLVFTSLEARSRPFSHLIRGFGEARHYFRRRMWFDPGGCAVADSLWWNVDAVRGGLFRTRIQIRFAGDRASGPVDRVTLASWQPFRVTMQPDRTYVRIDNYARTSVQWSSTG